MQIDDPNESETSKLWKAVKKLQGQAGLGQSSVSDHQTQFIGMLSLLVSGSAKVTGELIIDGDGGQLTIYGDVDGQGDFTWTGPETHRGDERHEGSQTYLGPERHEGDLTYIGGETHIGPELHRGNSTQEGNLDVTGGGKITVQGAGDMIIGTLASGRAGIHFAGGELSSDGDQVALTAGSNFVGAGGGNSILGAGGHAVVVRDNGIYLLGLPSKPGGTTPTGGGGGGTTDPPPIEA